MTFKYFPTSRDLFGEFDRFFVGFDDTFKRMQNFSKDYAKSISSNYPPFNVKKVNDGQYVLELAVAGFGKSDLDIQMKDSVLTITGRTNFDSDKGQSEYLVKGIAERAFERSFNLSDTVEVKNAELVNGMLKIYLDSLVPVTKAVKIAIQDGVNAMTKTIESMSAKTDKKDAA